MARWQQLAPVLFVAGVVLLVVVLIPGVGREVSVETDVGFAMRRARSEDLLWDRATFELPHRLGVTVVYGHTPSPDFEVRWNLPWSIGIDTGAVYGGRLTAIRLPDETVFQV